MGIITIITVLHGQPTPVDRCTSFDSSTSCRFTSFDIYNLQALRGQLTPVDALPLIFTTYNFEYFMVNWLLLYSIGYRCTSLQLLSFFMRQNLRAIWGQPDEVNENSQWSATFIYVSNSFAFSLPAITLEIFYFLKRSFWYHVLALVKEQDAHSKRRLPLMIAGWRCGNYSFN